MKMNEKVLKLTNLLKHHKKTKVKNYEGREEITLGRHSYDKIGFIKEGNFIRFSHNSRAYIDISTNQQSSEFLNELKRFEEMLNKYMFHYDMAEVNVLKNLEKYYENKFYMYRDKKNYLMYKNVKEQRVKKEFEHKIRRRRENQLHGFLYKEMIKLIKAKVQPSVRKIGGLTYMIA